MLGMTKLLPPPHPPRVCIPRIPRIRYVLRSLYYTLPLPPPLPPPGMHPPLSPAKRFFYLSRVCLNHILHVRNDQTVPPPTPLGYAYRAIPSKDMV